MWSRTFFPQGLFLLLGGLAWLASPQPVRAFSARPEDPGQAEIVDLLLKTDFSKQCDISTYPLKKNLSYLFDNKYIGLEFKSWEVQTLSGQTYQVQLRYVDGDAGPTQAQWKVDMEAKKARFGDENAEVLSCMTGYL